MPKPIIKLRKLLYLPVKWKMAKAAKASQVELPDPKRLIELQQKINNKQVLYLRKSDIMKAGRMEEVSDFLDALINNKIGTYEDKTL